VANFLWPVLVPALAFSAIWVWLAWRSAGWAVGLLTFVAGFAVTVVLLLLSAFLIYRGLRKREESDAADNSLPNEQVLSRIVADENKAIQNHMTGVSIMKPGRLRRFTLRLAFWVIGALAGRQFRPGYLADIGTIHFARWVLLPGTDKLLFFSNYGGSWESYLEDFITKAHDGLTAVWSNTLGFPKARNLFFDGATDGDRFKRWARRQHRPTAFWYSAYPNLSTDRIRSNAALRQGLVCAATEDEAQAWLSLLGSRTPPAALIETPEVQTIVFGGLKKHPFSACLLLSLPADRSAARAWLRLAKARASFGDQPGPELVGLLALAVGGLRKLGLGERDIASFPQAYRDGIAHPSRSKILGDTGDDKPAEWIWGNDSKPADAALVLYAASARLLRRSLAEAVAEIERAGGAVVHRVPLRQLAKGAQLSAVGARNQEHEAFGFADGVSQPIIKGTRRWLTDEDQIHSVEPGEFLLGYPANRGYLPLTPTVPAEADPSNLLTVPDPAHGAWPVFERSGANSDRDLGRNGSFLVVRQLGQDVAGFKRSVAEVAAACADHRGIPPGLDQKQREQWIAAKIIGRWRDGTSLVRYPHRPGTGWNGEFPHVEPDNAFLLGAEDPVGHRCPFGSHIRRTNPRDSFTPGSMEQLAITNRHRILRMGRRYDAYRHDGRREPEGLFFMCLNADLERQFEFIQQTWSMALQFHGLENEVDPILGRGLKTGRLTIPTPYGPIQVKGLGDVVQVRGGGYFFLPGRRALEWLAA
jgi:deferrochelatase/peroxidase EfeB